jgi:CubicO group peptidase (beta-lactamase class C family)
MAGKTLRPWRSNSPEGVPGEAGAAQSIKGITMMMRSETGSFESTRFICPCRLSAAAALLLISLTVHPVHASQDRFGGVFHEGTDPHNLQSGLTWNQLVDTMADFGERGQKLVDVEIIQRQLPQPDRCDPPTFAGVWREGDYGQSIIGGLIWNDFKKQVKIQRKRYGMRLTDIETHVECGIRKFVGVFREGSDDPGRRPEDQRVRPGRKSQHKIKQKLKQGMTWDAFTDKSSSLHEDGWHLIDIETYEDNGVRYWAAIWNDGYQEEWLWVFPREQFEAVQEFLDGSQQLVDMESWREGGDREGSRIIAGLFYGSDDPAIMEAGENWTKFTSLWAEQSDDENRLVDLEVYPDTTDRRWGNSFFQGLDGKAMGWSFAVAESGHLAAAGAEGWARSPNEATNPSVSMMPDSVMNVASVTKLLTVVGILKIHEQTGGTWFIDVPFASYFHVYYDTSTFGQGVNGVTLRHLMTQKTCMKEPDLTPLGSNYKDRIGEWLKEDLKSGCTPGTGGATYYNHYFNLLLMVIEAATFQDYETWMNNNVFSPVGIGPLACGAKTTYGDPVYYPELPFSGSGVLLDPPGTKCFEGPDGVGGAWYASSIDMARFIASFRDGTIIGPASVQMMETEVMAWYWHDDPVYPEVSGQKNGGIGVPGGGMGTDVMALVDDFDVAIIFNSSASVSSEQLILDAYHAPEDW